jgi:MFS family permease
MPGVYRPAPANRLPRAGLFSPFLDARFQRLLLFGCWFSFFNGLTQTAQTIFPRKVLDLDVFYMAGLRVLMQVGQIGLTPWVGSFSDRYGNRPTLIVCQLVVATAPLFYLAATPAQPWWIAGAWLIFSAYVGLNICLPNLMLKLSPGHDKSAYVATYFAITGLAYAASTVAGGWLFDFLQFQSFPVGPFTLSNYGYLFYIAWVTRTLAVVLLLAVVEPGAWTWWQIIRGRRTADPPPGEAAEPA